MKKVIGVLTVLLVLISCGDDDELPQSEPPRPLSEVLVEDDAEIRAFLETHFYNYEDFQEPIDPNFDFKIVFDSITGENSDKTPLIEQVQSQEFDVSDFEFGIDVGERDIPHTLYYLEAFPGVGPSPTVADSAFVRISGTLLNGDEFQSSTPGVWFDLARLQAPLQGVRGFAEGIPFFKSGGTPITNIDGTFDVNDFGVGILFIPSGLAYFNSGPSPVQPYDPLIFTIEVLAMAEADHDQDGIPSIEEDLDGNGYLYDDNTNQAEEEEFNGGQLLANFLDLDDDGDGVRTRVEISDADGNIIFPYPNTTGGPLPDYLNPDVQRDPNDN